jgi:serine protease Do
MSENVKEGSEALDAYSRAVIAAAERVGPAVVQIGTQERSHLGGSGSGTIFSSEGQILTNAHVVKGARRLQVALGDGRRFLGGVVGLDEETDLAVLRIGARHLPVAELSDRPLQVGQLVVAVGNPYGLGWSVTAGVVSALERNIQIAPGRRLKDLIQTDTSINPGNSGGPLVDIRGRVVGINTAVIPFAQGLGFAISTKRVYEALVRILLPREPPSSGPRLGLGGMRTAIEGWVVKKYDLKRGEGVLVLEIAPGSPAERASLKLLDIIISVDGRPVGDVAELQQAIAGHKPGDAVQLVFVREGKVRRTTLILDASPAMAGF